MRKRPVRKEIRTLKEIFDQELRSGFLLYSDQDSRQADTSAARLQLLCLYANIATLPDTTTTLKEFGNASDYYQKMGCPTFIGKDYRKGDLVRSVEVIPVIVQSSKSLKGLITLYEHWKNENIPALRKLLVDAPIPQVPLVPRIETEREQETARNRETHRRIIQLMLQKQIEKKYDRQFQNSQSNVFISTALDGYQRKGERKKHFQNAKSAWYSDYVVFCSEQIEPFVYPESADASDQQILDFAKDQLIKAANIMLKGIQPLIIVDPDNDNQLRYRYEVRCDWHVIAKAFAELVTDKELSLEPRECEVCKTDISNLISSAKKCTECSSKKRKRKS